MSYRDREAIIASLAPRPNYSDSDNGGYDEGNRTSNIIFLIETMAAIGLQDHLASDHFKKVYYAMPCCLTVRGFAEYLVGEQCSQSHEGDRGRDTASLLVSVGFKREAAERLSPSIADKRSNPLAIAKQAVDKACKDWANEYYKTPK
ncbi:hypothetical protein QKT49_gp358 [Acanthamoeba castellanii medusavirus]|uniref:Uncharacterized protein n=1 Tax=Acanthamoeba castellanii medusavirus J1 TaxID=3114988 RepID=A0A3T1CX73_9VIRU|nr:hypothetical protein QKT49_gp358 [Acanthamoeba castellanii medusavirus]BBI30405.1 hypothetical protein [Acanthamoeba castellanii medusavirus J1]